MKPLHAEILDVIRLRRYTATFETDIHDVIEEWSRKAAAERMIDVLRSAIKALEEE